MKRKRAALLFADIAGYTRLISHDEQNATLAVAAVFEEFVYPAVHAHAGRIVQMEGDGMFAEFGSANEAVHFAVGLQQAMASYNQQRPAERKIEFRVGINYGDVIVDHRRGRLSGTAVNIAARLEQIADVGGIWVSEQVVSDFGQEAGIAFVSLGSRRLKNIAGRVPVYGVVWGDDTRTDTYAGYSRDQFRSITPSIAVLPFRILERGSLEEHMSQALVEDVMTELGRFTEITIISPDTTAIYREQVPDVKEIGRRLGVDYIITGSVNRREDNVVVHARLFETDVGEQIWANRYDSPMRQLQSLQDDVAHDLAGKLPLRVENVSLTRSHRKPIESLDAYDCYLQGRALYREKNELTDRQAVELLERAIALDPMFADPYAVLGAILGINWAYSCWGVDPRDKIIQGRNLIKKALSLNHNLARAHGHLAWTYLSTEEFEKALDCFDIATTLNPNDVDVLLLKAYAMMYMGEPLESIRICRDLMKLNPRFPGWYTDALGGAQFIAGEYEQALESLQQVDDLFPENKGWIAACQAHMDLLDEARASAQQFIERVRPIWKGPANAGPAEYVRWFLYVASPFMIDKDRRRMLEGLRKCGLPVPP